MHRRCSCAKPVACGSRVRRCTKHTGSMWRTKSSHLRGVAPNAIVPFDGPATRVDVPGAVRRRRACGVLRVGGGPGAAAVDVGRDEMDLLAVLVGDGGARRRPRVRAQHHAVLRGWTQGQDRNTDQLRAEPSQKAWAAAARAPSGVAVLLSEAVRSSGLSRVYCKVRQCDRCCAAMSSCAQSCLSERMRGQASQRQGNDERNEPRTLSLREIKCRAKWR